MRTFLLIGSDDNGVHTIRVTKATSIQEAIEDKFHFYPLNQKKIVKEMQEAGEISAEQVRMFLPADPEKPQEGSFMSWGAREVREKVVHTLRNRAAAFFNLYKDSDHDRRAAGNYVDGDSVSSWIIIEIEPGGSVSVYPMPQHFRRE